MLVRGCLLTRLSLVDFSVTRWLTEVVAVPNRYGLFVLILTEGLDSKTWFMSVILEEPFT